MDTPTPEGQKEITTTIRLEYADATQLETVLQQVWEGEGGDGGGFSFRRFFAVRWAHNNSKILTP